MINQFHTSVKQFKEKKAIEMAAYKEETSKVISI